jgi:hypothetical protein
VARDESWLLGRRWTAIIAVLFFAILLDPNQPSTFSARVIAWDDVVGVGGVAATLILAGALVVARGASTFARLRFSRHACRLLVH